MTKKPFWLITLFIGILPYCITLIISIYKMFVGWSGLCITGCQKEYGIKVFVDIWFIYVYLYFYVYIIGLILIIISLIKLSKSKK